MAGATKAVESSTVSVTAVSSSSIARSTTIAVSVASRVASVLSVIPILGLASSSATSANGVLSCNHSQKVWDLLVGLAKKFNQVFHNVLVSSVDKGSGDTSISCSSCSSDTVDVVVNIVWKIIVDHMSHIRDIQSSSSNSGGNQNWRSS
ncbi:hypothetical protein OGATHE_001198 [Ogataea polymorpha]|uniref:Uncharacterized protein n=1 Tax=Ogataea polymorpha TaxID=460523 RepID=A0A9P8PSW0_9ASCO|nr:hypothetical protein OGATHE_001198 [Ogataea polymorpha]